MSIIYLQIKGQWHVMVHLLVANTKYILLVFLYGCHLEGRLRPIEKASR